MSQDNTEAKLKKKTHQIKILLVEFFLLFVVSTLGYVNFIFKKNYSYLFKLNKCV